MICNVIILTMQKQPSYKKNYAVLKAWVKSCKIKGGSQEMAINIIKAKNLKTLQHATMIS